MRLKSLNLELWFDSVFFVTMAGRRRQNNDLPEMPPPPAPSAAKKKAQPKAPGPKASTYDDTETPDFALIHKFFEFIRKQFLGVIFLEWTIDCLFPAFLLLPRTRTPSGKGKGKSPAPNAVPPKRKGSRYPPSYTTISNVAESLCVCSNNILVCFWRLLLGLSTGL